MSDNGGREIEKKLTRRIEERVIDYRSYAQDCNSTLNETLAEVHDIVQKADLINYLNSLDLFDAVSTKQNVNVNEMMDMYDNEDYVEEERESETMKAFQNASEEAPDTITTLNSMPEVALDTQGIAEDGRLINALRAFQERFSALKDAHSYALDK